MNKRTERVNSLIQKEVGAILLREIELPDGAVATLTRVACSGNLQEAKVYVSVIPDERAQEVVHALAKNVWRIQQLLNERLRMRPVPKIHWVAEEAGAHTQRIERLLEKVKEIG